MKKLFGSIAVILVLTGCTPKYDDPHTPRASKGSPSAQIKVEEFGDFQCPACGQAYPVVKRLQAKYDQRVNWQFINFPLTSVHPYAFNAALAAACANDQDKFWEYHDTLYENQDHLSRGDLEKYAGTVGLDVEKFKACLGSRAKASFVQADIAEADKRGVDSTPTFFVNGVAIPDWSKLESEIDRLMGTPAPPVTPGAPQPE
mgnify:CR=1 FL=1